MKHELDPNIIWLFIAMIATLVGIGFAAHKADQEERKNEQENNQSKDS